MDAAGALALRRYIESRRAAGFVEAAPEKARIVEPSGLPHIDDYVRAFHDSAATAD
jgi:hypothetical protein